MRKLILAGLLAGAGLLHIGLLRDLELGRGLAFALGVGLLGFLTNIAVGLAVGLVLWWGPSAARVLRGH